MATNITPTGTFDDVPLIDVGDQVKGGADGAANKQAIALANRTQFLKAAAEKNATDIANTTPDKIGAAKATHLHVSADVTDLDPHVSDLMTKIIKPGAGVTIGYDPAKNQILIAAKQLADMPGANDFLTFERNGAVAGQTFSFVTQAINSYKYQAYALKKEAGAANQNLTLDVFNAAAVGRYNIMGGVQFTSSGVNLENLYTVALNYDNTRFYTTGIPLAGDKIVIDFDSSGYVPVLTSNTGNAAFQAIASSAWNTGISFPQWHAFSDMATGSSGEEGWASASVPTRSAPQWLGIKMDRAVKINAYSFQNRMNGDMATPSSFQFQGSNDGTTWVNIDAEQTNSNVTAGAVVKIPVVDQTPYSSYRILVYASAGVGNSKFVYIRRMQIFTSKTGLLSTTDKSTFYKAVNGTLTQVDASTDALFNSNAFGSSGAIKQSDLAAAGITQIVSLSQQTITTRSLYLSRLMTMKSLIAGTQWQVINNMTVTGSVTNNGVIKGMLTRNLTDYFYLDGSGAWVKVTLTFDQAGANLMQSNGMTLAQINAITKAQWASFYADVGGMPDYLGFAFGLLKPALTDTVTLNSVAVNVDNVNVYKLQTPAEVEIRWNRAGLTFKTMAAGDYILGYQIP